MNRLSMTLTTRMIRTLKLLAIAVAALIAGGMYGCSSSQPVGLWQECLTDYVADQGNGDITCLRNTEPGAAQPVFGVTSGTTEVQGLLVGAASVDSQRWWTYIVAVMKDDQVQDLRAIAVCDDDGTLIFREGPDDEAAVQRYRASRLNQWKSNRSDGSTDDNFIFTFPGRNDVFALQSAANTASITEKQSGVRWVILLADNDSPATRAAK